MVDRFKPMTPKQRKEALDKIPNEEWKENARKWLKEANLDVPD